jgi:hypothetical protein
MRSATTAPRPKSIAQLQVERHETLAGVGFAIPALFLFASGAASLIYFSGSSSFPW